ncbi:MAG: cytochrome c3 family protein [Verrucomicrobiales bacterium]
MAQFFPRWSNTLPLKLAICAGAAGVLVSMAVPYYFTPKYTRVGYEPTQPVPFDHNLHAGQLGMDCRYCHSFVEKSPHSNIPTTQVCMNCHKLVQKENPKLEPVRQSYQTGEPIRWVKIHHPPDYVYFDHSAHVNRGVSCASCHGKVNEMKVVRHDQPHSMGWCLDCHRAPETALRPLDQVTNLNWKPEDLTRDDFYSYLSSIGGEVPEEHPDGDLTQEEVGMALKKALGINPPEHCAGCHR